MKINSISGITCYVSDLTKTAKFYESLGFRFGKQEEDRLTCYINWFWIVFIQERKNRISVDEGMAVYLKVDDVNEYYNNVVSQGMKPEINPIKKSNGMVEFLLKDPDGYNLVFFEKK